MSCTRYEVRGTQYYMYTSNVYERYIYVYIYIGSRFSAYMRTEYNLRSSILFYRRHLVVGGTDDWLLTLTLSHVYISWFQSCAIMLALLWIERLIELCLLICTMLETWMSQPSDVACALLHTLAITDKLIFYFPELQKEKKKLWSRTPQTRN